MERVERSSPPVCATCGLVPFAPRLSGATEVVAESEAMQAVLRRVARKKPLLLSAVTGQGVSAVLRALAREIAKAKEPALEAPRAWQP